MQLYKRNITSEQLYHWSAPMDVVERYQVYLNHLVVSNEMVSMSTQLFYNCTLPRFGPICEYSLDIYESHHLSLKKSVYNFYQQPYNPMNLTCYTHLECNHSTKSTCLDWAEICDEMIDCHGGVDEQFCSQLEFNKCEEDEIQCHNAQCISNIFRRDGAETYECVDQSDEALRLISIAGSFAVDVPAEPAFFREDVVCPRSLSSIILSRTSSCVAKRDAILKKFLLADTPKSVPGNCWLAVTCELRNMQTQDPECRTLCSNRTCIDIITEACPDMFPVPAAGTIAFGHIFFAYTKEDIIKRPSAITPPPRYICYNDQLCSGLYPNRSSISFNGATCRRPTDIPLSFRSAPLAKNDWHNMYTVPVFNMYPRCNKINYINFASCNSSTVYQCHNSSKCISNHRHCDGIPDCPYKDDEECSSIDGVCSIRGGKNLFKCTTKNKCISPRHVDNDVCNCDYDENGLCDDEDPMKHYRMKHISFPRICDGFTELIPVIIDGRNETDETECDYWQCNNTYTRCDGFWNCYDGADEVGCDPSPLLNCSHHHHICVAPITNQFMCLPLKQANDGNIDCLGGTDEPKLCRSNNYKPKFENFYCMKNKKDACLVREESCYGKNCDDGTDERFCHKTLNIKKTRSLCYGNDETVNSDIKKFFCERKTDVAKPQIVYFTLGKLKNSSNHTIQQKIDEIISHSSIQHTIPRQYQQLCHRGLVLHRWINNNKNSTKVVCLCPPAYYGDHCQYQNQRVSLTMRFQTYSDSRRIPFILVVLLIDDSDERIIHSYQQLSFLYMQQCRKKFNVYLLYSTRPKLPGRNYSIHIDIYEKIKLVYRGSLLIQLNFPFLPVHRVAVQLTIPPSSETMETCSDQKCNHGRCKKYFNDRNGNSFCHCDRGWSGRYCSIKHTCTCASDSSCVDVSANNRSICVCPSNKWGPTCLLRNTVCRFDQNSTCQNGGACIHIDENMISGKQFICICRKGFSGERCEQVDSTITVSFHKDINLRQSILFHFIRVIDNGPSESGTTFKTIFIHHNSITVQWPYPFHIVFAEPVNNKYYLISVQQIYNRSAIISKTINPSDRCEYISEVLNETIVNFHLLRRIKYYHLPCQIHSPILSCFYDDSYFCLCTDFGHQRVANCFEFNHSIVHNCFGLSNCENGAQCVQNNATCPQTSICVCPTCFFGARCQFSLGRFSLSLDAILGYHIQPYVKITHQSRVIKVSVALAVLIMIGGLINGVLSLITFKNKELQKNGCGLYLLGSSITSILVTSMFTLKFWMLIVSQMKYVTNQSFLNVQCRSIDFLLQICLNMDKWLNACVAGERAFTAMKGAEFSKKKSKKTAKYIILALFILIISTSIHDPIYRRLLSEENDDINEDRIWCITSYPPHLQTFNSFILMFHFFVPFLTHIISTIMIIVVTARLRTTVQAHQTYQKMLHGQFQQHKHLLVAPVLLIGLALPSLIISFMGGCMKSTNEPWLYLIGYLISFIPSMVTFLIVVLPSNSYSQVFETTIKGYQRTIRSKFNLNS